MATYLPVYADVDGGTTGEVLVRVDAPADAAAAAARRAAAARYLASEGHPTPDARTADKLARHGELQAASCARRGAGPPRLARLRFTERLGAYVYFDDLLWDVDGAPADADSYATHVARAAGLGAAYSAAIARALERAAVAARAKLDAGELAPLPPPSAAGAVRRAPRRGGALVVPYEAARRELERRADAGGGGGGHSVAADVTAT